MLDIGLSRSAETFSLKSHCPHPSNSSPVNANSSRNSEVVKMPEWLFYDQSGFFNISNEKNSCSNLRISFSYCGIREVRYEVSRNGTEEKVPL